MSSSPPSIGRNDRRAALEFPDSMVAAPTAAVASNRVLGRRLSSPLCAEPPSLRHCILSVSSDNRSGP
jgi:hypothetical protein